MLTDIGLIATYNAGDARKRGLDVSVGWHAPNGLSLTGGMLVQRACIRALTIATGPDRRLPVIPDIAIHGEAGWTGQLGAWRLTTPLGTLHREARLSFDPALDRESKPPILTTASINAEDASWSTRLSIDNLADSRADTFSFGNSFSVAATPQFTPLRPRSVTLALRRRF